MKDADRLTIRDHPRGAVISVKVVPASSRDKVVGVLGDALKIATAAAPEKGKANTAVARTVAKALGVDARSLELIAGRRTGRKEFRVRNLSAEILRRKLEQLG